ncbi:MAG TPA: hypothetical protein VJK48_04165 [Chlamydiales bacterium]|nr:hypothetical protein [Chlamydiales bacterium]
MNHPPALIIRHNRENLNKCSLRGLEGKEGFHFYTYPKDILPNLSGYLLLKVGARPLGPEDLGRGLLLIDATWRLAQKIEKQLPLGLEACSLPSHFRTAYPRRQTHCPDPETGLASIEALFLSYYLMGRSIEGILDHYYWKEPFLRLNQSYVSSSRDNQ